MTEVFITTISVSDSEWSVDIRFHDGAQKKLKIHRRDLAANRCSERDYIENTITDYYESIGYNLKDLKLIFL